MSKTTQVTQALSCIGKTYDYPITQYFDGHKRVKTVRGVCIGYDSHPPGQQLGDYLVMRAHSDMICNDQYASVPLMDVKEVRTHANRSKDNTNSPCTVLKQE